MARWGIYHFGTKGLAAEVVAALESDAKATCHTARPTQPVWGKQTTATGALQTAVMKAVPCTEAHIVSQVVRYRRLLWCRQHSSAELNLALRTRGIARKLKNSHRAHALAARGARSGPSPSHQSTITACLMKTRSSTRLPALHTSSPALNNRSVVWARRASICSSHSEESSSDACQTQARCLVQEDFKWENIMAQDIFKDDKISDFKTGSQGSYKENYCD